MVSFGSKRSTQFARSVSDDAIMEPGKIYHAYFVVEGIRTMLPGWENDVISTIRTSLYEKGCEVTYMNVDDQNHSATVQYRLMNSSNATAMIFPVLAVLSIVYIITIVVGIYLISLTLVGAVKEISNIAIDNPIMTPIIYGGLAIVGIVALIYLKDRFSSSSSKSSG